MSIDRLLTLYCSYPVSKLFRTKEGKGVPIVMYHSISDGPETGVIDYYKIDTSRSVFRMHMRYLHEEGYSVVNLPTACEALSSGTAMSGKYAVLTFDDGHRNFYTDAFPILKEFGFTATVFLPTAFIGKNGRGLKGKEHLDWEQIEEMHNEGIIFGSHTVTHRQLEDLDSEEIYYELSRSKAAIEDHINARVDSFSYPFAFPETGRKFTRRLRELLERSGYMNGVTTCIGTATTGCNRYFLSRLPVSSRDDTKLFQAKLEGGYDWLRMVQYLFKLAKRTVPKSSSAKKRRRCTP